MWKPFSPVINMYLYTLVLVIYSSYFESMTLSINVRKRANFSKNFY